MLHLDIFYVHYSKFKGQLFFGDGYLSNGERYLVIAIQLSIPLGELITACSSPQPCICSCFVKLYICCGLLEEIAMYLITCVFMTSHTTVRCCFARYPSTQPIAAISTRSVAQGLLRISACASVDIVSSYYTYVSTTIDFLYRAAYFLLNYVFVL